MAKREIKFSLVYRDMWQSSGRYQPRVDQLVRVAPAIVDMGCFDRVETNGGAFEQVNLLYGENPNVSVRQWTAPFHKAGIQTHMLERGLNAIRMYPVPADVRELMFKVKKKQGTDIARSFCGLNDHRNLKLSIEFAKKGGMISQAALSITHSPVHTVEYYLKLVDQLVEYGTDEICLKDMAGVGRPTELGQIVAGIKKAHPHIKVQYHGHTGPGFSPASMLEVARAGADYLAVAVEPLSWGKVHPDVISMQQMMKADGFQVKDINMDAYMEVRRLTQEFIDDFLGYWINPTNSQMSSLLVGCGLPGGMMGSMMADLKGFESAINAAQRAHGRPEMSMDTLMVKLFDEVEYVWPRLGYPPLVTPFSQYVKNTALMNLFNMVNDKPRWTTIDKDTWGMILGKMGKLPGELAPEIVALAKEKGMESDDEGRRLGLRRGRRGTPEHGHVRASVPRLPQRYRQGALQQGPGRDEGQGRRPHRRHPSRRGDAQVLRRRVRRQVPEGHARAGARQGSDALAGRCGRRLRRPDRGYGREEGRSDRPRAGLVRHGGGCLRRGRPHRRRARKAGRERRQGRNRRFRRVRNR